MVLRAADADVGPARYADFAATVARYVTEVKKLADDQRAKDMKREELTTAGDFKLASNAQDPTTAPTPKAPTPLIDFAMLEKASDRLARSAGAADGVLAKADTLSPATRAKLDADLRGIDQTMLDPQGLPGRPWYRNMIYAPGTLTGYGAKTLPGIREGIEQRRFDDARAYVVKVAASLNAYADRLDLAVRDAKP
jgi:N-acetylated-alpha-linked acidic dipeptidase